MTVNFPTSYDTQASLFGDVKAMVVVTLNGGINASVTAVTFNETTVVDALDIDTELAFEQEGSAAVEVVRIDSHGTTGILNVERGFNSTLKQIHVDNAVATQDPTAYDWEILKEVLIASQKYKGIVGLDASKGSPTAAGQVYIAYDTSKVYVCFNGSSWTNFAVTDHGLLSNLDSDDHDTGQYAYHTATRKASWHTALTGDHLQTIAHDHRGSGTYGNPTKKFLTGLDASKGSPSVTGQVYYASDTGNLYFSADGIAWTRYASMPKGSIMFFSTACPSGWSEVASLDLTFAKGADAAEWTGLGTGGATTHVHEMIDVVNHAHDVSAQVGRTSSSDGSHTHGFDIRAGTGSLTRAYYYTSVSTAYLNTSGSGSHTHTITIAAYNTEGAGSNPANTDTASSLPSYYKLRACERD